jgi:2-polyprenyl-3-methyl-5-hydroxy-6-metoxy-1,4-benzoquinol methylase
MEINPYNREPLRFWNNMPVFSETNDYTENYEKVTSDQVAHIKKTGQNPFMQEIDWIAAEKSTRIFINKYMKKNDKILDVGVGMGRLLKDYRELDKYGMDISTSYINYAQESNINCCISLVEDMPYKNDFFDIVTCTDVLEHVLDLYSAVKNILRVLKPGGILIVRVPYREDLTWYLSEDCPYEYAHVRSFDENNLKALFTKIFKTKILDLSTAGEWLAESRLKYPVPPYNRYLKSFVGYYYKRKQKTDPEMYKTFFYNNEINVVVEKPFLK